MLVVSCGVLVTVYPVLHGVAATLAVLHGAVLRDVDVSSGKFAVLCVCICDLKTFIRNLSE